MHEFYRKITEALLRGETVAHLKVIEVAGSGPQEVGASILLHEDGGFEGTIGGGAVEAAALKDAAKMLRERRSGVLRYHLARDLGMSCGGRMEIFCEVLEPGRRLLLFGGGHVGQAIASMASGCGFEVVVIDERDDWANPDRFPQAAEILNLPVEEACRTLRLRPRDFVVSVTRGHKHDQKVLEHYLEHPPAYLGVMGSLSKVARMIAACRKRGFTDDQLARVHMPIGLDLGAVTPQEIAVAVVAELVAHHRGRGRRIAPLSMNSLNRLHAPHRTGPTASNAAAPPKASPATPEDAAAAVQPGE